MVLEYRVGWTVPGGGAGLSVFHGRSTGIGTDSEAAEDMQPRVRAFFAALAPLFHPTVVWSFPDEVTELNTTTGVLEDVYSVEGGANITGSGSGSFAAPAGARVVWATEAIVAGKRLRGSTFLVPLLADLYDGSGTISDVILAQISAAAEDYRDNTLTASFQASVWSRTHGIQADITGHTVPDKAAILSSRRD